MEPQNSEWEEGVALLSSCTAKNNQVIEENKDENNLREEYELLLDRAKKEGDSKEITMKIRSLIINHGIPEKPTSLRGRIWIYFMHIDKMDPDHYIELISQGPSELSKKIKKDTYRTFTNSSFYTDKVSEHRLIRVLNAIVHDCGCYVQGMNILCAPLLCCMSEVEAFYVFKRLVSRVYPTYVLNRLEGVYAGIIVLDLLLKELDKELWEFSNSFSTLKNPVLWQFGYTMTFGANMPPLTEVLRLWDFLFAFGFSLNLLLLMCRLIVIKDQLLTSSKPYELLRESLPLNADKTLELAVKLATKIPEGIRSLMVHHMTDIKTCEELTGIRVTQPNSCRIKSLANHNAYSKKEEEDGDISEQ